MQLKDLNRIAPIVKDKLLWDAFMYLLDLEEQKIILRLTGKPTEYELIRIAGQYDLIQALRKLRDNSLALEKNKEQ